MKKLLARLEAWLKSQPRWLHSLILTVLVPGVLLIPIVSVGLIAELAGPGALMLLLFFLMWAFAYTLCDKPR
jgi:hypothetical protein